MARRGRKPPVTNAAPIQAGPPQSMPLAGEFPPSPMGVAPQILGQTPPPSPGMKHAKVSKAKHKHARGK
jgi:hypothetical protein